MGRKPLAGKRKEGEIRVRLTDEERALLDAAADRQGTKTSTFMRDVALRAARRVMRK